jgi:RHS repeat-associated protein
MGQPIVQNGTRSAQPPFRPWRGYAYTPRAQLDRIWEHGGGGTAVDTTGLSVPVSTSDIDALGARNGAAQFRYDRSAAMGDLAAIRDPLAAMPRWAATALRALGHQLTNISIGAAAHTLSHDAEGNVATDNARAYRFDPHGWLAAVLDSGAVAEAYALDASGRIAALFKGTAATPSETYAYDGAQMAAAYDPGGTLSWQASWGASVDHLVAVRDGDGEGAPLADHRNSIIAVLRPSNGLAETAEYTPEGRVALRRNDGSFRCDELSGAAQCPNPSGIPFGLSSLWRSKATGLMWMRERWYSPELGEFTARDPVAPSDSLNAYEFAASDPINRRDPFGGKSTGFSSGGSSGSRSSAPAESNRSSSRFTQSILLGLVRSNQSRDRSVAESKISEALSRLRPSSASEALGRGALEHATLHEAAQCVQQEGRGTIATHWHSISCSTTSFIFTKHCASPR